jgi:hypothetical protein
VGDVRKRGFAGVKIVKRPFPSFLNQNVKFAVCLKPQRGFALLAKKISHPITFCVPGQSLRRDRYVMLYME